jgi:hypothetical protein
MNSRFRRVCQFEFKNKYLAQTKYYSPNLIFVKMSVFVWSASMSQTTFIRLKFFENSFFSLIVFFMRVYDKP